MRYCVHGLSLIVGFILTAFAASAQVTPSARADSVAARRGPYTLVVTVGTGLSCYARTLGVPPTLEEARVQRFGVPASLRLMWYPDHRLRVGVETGRLTLYGYQGRIGGERTRVTLSTVPVLLVVSMPLAWLSETLPGDKARRLARRLALTTGTGVYVNQSYLDYAGTVRNHALSLGWMVAGSYTHPINRRLGLATELKWFDAPTAQNTAFTAELQLVWRAFSW